MSYVPQQDTPQAFGASLWGGREGEKRVDVTVVGNSIEETIEALKAAVLTVKLQEPTA
jgi:hypothetical protein